MIDPTPEKMDVGKKFLSSGKNVPKMSLFLFFFEKVGRKKFPYAATSPRGPAARGLFLVEDPFYPLRFIFYESTRIFE